MQTKEYLELRAAVQQLITALRCSPEGRDLTLPAQYRSDGKDGKCWDAYIKLQRVLYPERSEGQELT